MPGLGIGLAAVTCESIGGTSIFPQYDGFWILAIANDAHGAINFTSGFAMTPFEIGVEMDFTSYPGDKVLDDNPDNTIWDLIDVGDGAGAVHYTPEATSTVANLEVHDAGVFNRHYWYIGHGSDTADTNFITTFLSI